MKTNSSGSPITSALERDSRAFPSTVLMLTALFGAGLIGILFFDYTYARPEDAALWEGRSDYLQATLGLSITFAGVVATIWIAFRIEAIARRQLANDNREHDLALIRFALIEPYASAAKRFLQAYISNRKALYLIEKAEVEVENWRYHKYIQLPSPDAEDPLEQSGEIDLTCRKCERNVRLKKAEKIIDATAKEKRVSETRSPEQTLRRNFLEMYSLLESLEPELAEDLWQQIPSAQLEELVTYVEGYINNMGPRDDASQSTKSFMVSLRSRCVHDSRIHENVRIDKKQAVAMFMEISAHEVAQRVESIGLNPETDDTLRKFDDDYWRTKFLRNMAFCESFEIGFYFRENVSVYGNMTQFLEKALLFRAFSFSAFGDRIDRYVAINDGIISPDLKTISLCRAEYVSALTQGFSDLTSNIIIRDALRRGVDKIPELRLGVDRQEPYYVLDEVEEEDEKLRRDNFYGGKKSVTCSCAHPDLALGS